MRRLSTWALLGALALLPSGCVVFDATSVGYAMLTGHRLVTVSGEAAWAQPKQELTAVNLKTGAVLARGSVDNDKRFIIRVPVPMNDDLALALHSPGNAALLLAPRGEKRQEERALNLTRGTTTVAWALGASLADLKVPGNEPWSASTEQWRTLGERLPASYGLALQASANTLDSVGIGSPTAAANGLDTALKSALSTVRVAAAGHPRDAALWPPVLLGWTNALTTLAPSAGDTMAAQAAGVIDVSAVVEQVWATAPYTEGQGGIELKVPLREPVSNRVPEALPAVIHGLRYQIGASLLAAPRQGTIARSAVRFQSGAAILRIPDMPEGFASIDVELLDESSASLGRVNAEAIVNRAIVRNVESTPIAVSLEGTPTTQPGIR